jgi:hypothetical protein
MPRSGDLPVSRSLCLALTLAVVMAAGTSLLASVSTEAAVVPRSDRAPMQAASPVHVNGIGRGGKPRSGTQNSLDWAGYAVTGAAFTNVAGSWTQPVATCPKSQAQQAAFWVGLDGYAPTDPTVEQIGTDSDCGRGRKTGGPTYYAWYQLYPQSDVVLPGWAYPVAPGDAIHASVSVSGSAYVLTISDGTKWHFTSTQTPATRPQNSSAEWITEAPSSCTASRCKILPLADFGSIAFTAASANHQPISSSGFTNYRINMASKGGRKVKAQTSALTSGGSAFSITWLGN